VITRDSVVVGLTSPDMSEDAFVAVVVPKSSLIEQDARAAYKAIVAERVSPAFTLAIFWHESNFGRLGICHDFNTKSPGNTRSSVTLKGETIQTPQGTYIRYPSWEEGYRDLAVRLSTPNYIYGRKRLTSIAQIMPVFAPILDGNNPTLYIDKIVSLMNGWIQPGGQQESNTMTIQIDDRSSQLASGKSSDRGNYQIDELVLHETSGQNDVRNAAPDLARVLDNATISWFLTPRSDVSIHYLIGGENLGAPIYRLCPESQAAYHVIGRKGSVDGFSIDNHESIGIERMGQPNDNPGPNQTRALCELALDICKRNPRITPDRIFSHANLQDDRRDGNTLLAVVKKYVSDNLGVSHVESNNQGGGYNPNPNNLAIGQGMLDALRQRGLVALTNEMYFSPNANQPGLGQTSHLWAHDSSGKVFILIAIEHPETATAGKPAQWEVKTVVEV
jgi:hypothetical protein